MTPDQQRYLDGYLDEVQASAPSLRGPEARKALQAVYEEVFRTAKFVTAYRIFDGLRGRLLADLKLLEGCPEFPVNIADRFRTDPSGAVSAFLTSAYAAILDHVAEIGGLVLVGDEARPDDGSAKLSEADAQFIRVTQGQVGKA